MNLIPQVLDGDWIMPYLEGFREEWGDWNWSDEYFNTGYINYHLWMTYLLHSLMISQSKSSIFRTIWRLMKK